MTAIARVLGGFGPMEFISMFISVAFYGLLFVGFAKLVAYFVNRGRKDK